MFVCCCSFRMIWTLCARVRKFLTCARSTKHALCFYIRFFPLDFTEAQLWLLGLCEMYFLSLNSELFNENLSYSHEAINKRNRISFGQANIKLFKEFLIFIIRIFSALLAYITPPQKKSFSLYSQSWTVIYGAFSSPSLMQHDSRSPIMLLWAWWMDLWAWWESWGSDNYDGPVAGSRDVSSARVRMDQESQEGLFMTFIKRS